MTLAALWYTISCPLSPPLYISKFKTNKTTNYSHQICRNQTAILFAVFFFVAKINGNKKTNVFLPVGRWSNGIFVGLWPQLLKIQKKFFQNKNFKMFFFFNKKSFHFSCVCVSLNDVIIGRCHFVCVHLPLLFVSVSLKILCNTCQRANEMN